jgi:hypothetical protein
MTPTSTTSQVEKCGVNRQLAAAALHFEAQVLGHLFSDRRGQVTSSLEMDVVVGYWSADVWVLPVER